MRSLPKSESGFNLGGPRLVMLLVTLALILIGLVMVYSASVGEAVTNGSTDSSSYLIKQAIFAAIGGAAAVLIWRFCPPYIWRGRLTWIVLGVTMALLVATALYGVATNGAQRWIYIGGFSLQPSEFAKIAIIIAGARIFADWREGAKSMRTTAVMAIGLVIFPMGFLYVSQSDFGTTLIIAVGLLSVLFFGGASPKFIIGVILFCLVLAAISIFGTSYRADRLYFADPWADGQNGAGKGYQLIRSFYAFAQGGIFGAGIGNSTEKLTPLPECETDFIFAIVGEELGLIGAVVIIALFTALLVAGLMAASQSEDPFACMLAGGLTVMLVFQAFLNMGCVTGLLPTTGKPLPFISSGGSSMIASIIMVGFIMTAAPQGGHTSVYDKRRDNLRIVRSADATATRSNDTALGGRSRSYDSSQLSLASVGRSRQGASSQSYVHLAGARNGRRK